uniref:Apolipoprotein L n=1 Tax=Fundulus heteroclitus TaxID=8078 RepID=A0A3Q2SZD9_FUNHE
MWKLQRALCQYVTDTLSYMTTVKVFYAQFSEWKNSRDKENEKMMDIKKRADKIDPTFTKKEGNWAKFCNYVKRSFQMNPESKLAELENELDEVLKDTLEGLEELNTFVDAVEKLAVTSLDVFTENLVLHLPEKIRFDDVQAVIKTARQICPLLLEFKRNAESFFLPKLPNVEVLTYQLKSYIDSIDTICESHGDSFNLNICLDMSEDIAVNPDNLSENDMQKMINHIKQLDKIRMDEHFRMEFLFQKVSSDDFIKIVDDQLPKMLQFLDELEECAVNLDSMNKGAKISSVTGSSVGVAGGILSIVGLALIPVTAGVSSGLIIAGVSMGVTSGVNSLVTTLTEAGVNHTHQKKANEAFQSFMEEFQKIQECLNEVMKQSADTLEPGMIDLVVGVGKAVNNVGTIAKGADAIADAASGLKASGAGKAILQDGKALSNIASDVPDIGQAAVKGPLALSKGARAGFIALNAVFIAMDIFFITKDSMSLAKGNETKVSKFLRARGSLLRSQLESWEKIRNSLCQSKESNKENRNFLQEPFYPGIKKGLI